MVSPAEILLLAYTNNTVDEASDHFRWGIDWIRQHRHLQEALAHTAIEPKYRVLAHTRVIFYVRRIGLYLYKYRIYGTRSIYISKGLAFVYQLI